MDSPSCLTHADSRGACPSLSSPDFRDHYHRFCPLLGSHPKLLPAGNLPDAKPSPVRVGVKRKAPDVTPCQAKVRASTSHSQLFALGRCAMGRVWSQWAGCGRADCLPPPAPPSCSTLASGRAAVRWLHPVPSCCLAEAASQQAERKESCAHRQEIEQRGGCKDPPSCWSQIPVDIKGEEAQPGCGSAAV